jgi:hypothetical protein
MLSACDMALLNVYIAAFAILEREAADPKLQDYRTSNIALGDIR